MHYRFSTRVVEGETEYRSETYLRTITYCWWAIKNWFNVLYLSINWPVKIKDCLLLFFYSKSKNKLMTILINFFVNKIEWIVSFTSGNNNLFHWHTSLPWIFYFYFSSFSYEWKNKIKRKKQFFKLEKNTRRRQMLSIKNDAILFRINI